MTWVNAIGMDTGLANFGLAILHYDSETGEVHLNDNAMHHITTKFENNDAGDRGYFDRMSELRGRICLAFPADMRGQRICIESPSPAQSSSSSLAMGMAFGVTACAIGSRATRFATPQQIKVGIGLKNTATKEQVIEAVKARVGASEIDNAWAQHCKRSGRIYKRKAGKLSEIEIKDMSHPIDAMACAIVCLDREFGNFQKTGKKK